ncbi:hypothetical protein B566_EDAN015980, partial [Ephemera danica]
QTARKTSSRLNNLSKGETSIRKINGFEYVTFLKPCFIFLVFCLVVKRLDINKSIQGHDNSLRHMNNILNFMNLGQNSIEKSLDTIKLFWNIICKLIATMTFKKTNFLFLALLGHDEQADSNNPDVFLGLINFAKDLDDTLKKHLENPKYDFIGTSKTIQNELLQCMLDVCREQIKTEIKCADYYLAAICDDTTDISTKTQMTIVFRYVDANVNVVDRFWDFFEPKGQKCYDGAAVMSGEFNGVQSLFKLKHIYAHYIHCAAHQLNLKMERSLYVNKRVPHFFVDLHSIPKFFSHSTDRISALDVSLPTESIM